MLKRSLAGLAVAGLLTLLRLTPELSLFRTADAYVGFPLIRGDFEPVANSNGVLFKLFAPWHTTPFHKETLDVFAIDIGRRKFAVSDGGGYNNILQRAASQYVAALGRLLDQKNATLSYVLRAFAMRPTCQLLMHTNDTWSGRHPPT